MLETKSLNERPAGIDHGCASSEETVSSPVTKRGMLPRTELALSTSSLPQNVRKVEYAVRGPVAQRAVVLGGDLSGKPFTKILPCHIGNPMAVGMKPLTYIRETVCLLSNPGLLDRSDEELAKLFDPDNVARARRYIGFVKNPGAYTESLGADGFRAEVAAFLAQRDGTPPPPLNTIMMTNGASEAINTLLICLIGGPSDGVLLPIPQYPLYSATIAKLGGTVVPYYLCEEDGWSLDQAELQKAYSAAVEADIDVKALVVICPGNPAPTFLSREQIVSILKFADENKIFVIADEVYQDNCYDPAKAFKPFRKILKEEQLTTQLASLHSSSKGVYGECGFRGGMAQLENVDTETLGVIYKMRSVELCANTMGQCVTACVLNPPTEKDASYGQYMAERTATFVELKEKAILTADFFNSLEGVTCAVRSVASFKHETVQPISGAMYAFPKFEMPPAAYTAAREANQSVELFYCMGLVEATGIVTTNGDGFGQKEGTHHIRICILPAIDDLREGLERFRAYHINFLKTYA